jgi:hypothetical protein
MGPAVITTIGILFFLSQIRGGYFAFHHTFPVILIVIGAILLASSMAPSEGHISDAAVPPPPGSYQGPTAPPASGQGQ